MTEMSQWKQTLTAGHVNVRGVGDAAIALMIPQSTAVGSVSSKKVLRWANVNFSEHEYFEVEITEGKMIYKLCELLK